MSKWHGGKGSKRRNSNEELFKPTMCVRAAGHFGTLLKDGEHFIKVKRDFSDLVEKVEWLRANDAKAEEIGRAGQAKIAELMSNAGTECYVRKLLQYYATLLVD